MHVDTICTRHLIELHCSLIFQAMEVAATVVVAAVEAMVEAMVEDKTIPVDQTGGLITKKNQRV